MANESTETTPVIPGIDAVPPIIPARPQSTRTVNEPVSQALVDLQKRFAIMEDNRAKDQIIISDLTKLVEAARQAPSARLQGKSIFDEISEFMLGLE